ncbi:MAG: hypothetical protein HPY67_13780 [Syntrophaceae bacterium]|nr:hypothetical protein [Syntrophaceae bacterium]
MAKIIRFPRKPRKKREIGIVPTADILKEVLFGKEKKNTGKSAEEDHERQDK